MAKIVLVDPAARAALAHRSRPDWLRKYRYMPHLGLQVLAGLSAGHDVRIVDERIEEFDAERVDADLVGITVRTALAPRAHALAGTLHARGIPVVLGGPYATLTPMRALVDPNVGAVVTGPAESVWEQVLADCAAGTLARMYRGQLSNKSAPVERALPPGPYRPSLALVQVTKGCNFRCRFCVIPGLYEDQYVVPDPDILAGEIGALPHTYVFLVDDNLIGNRRFARALFERLAGLGKQWFCQCTLNVARDEELLVLMQRAGCRLVNIGLETLTPRTLIEQNKRQNFACEFVQAIRRLHDHGMLVCGGFVFGFDEDDAGVFDRTLEFTAQSKIDFAACHVFTPYPGLPEYESLKAQGRILTEDLSQYDTHQVVYRPARMSPECLQSGFDHVVREFYSLRGALSRTYHALIDLDFALAAGSGFTSLMVHSNLRRGLPVHA